MVRLSAEKQLSAVTGLLDRVITKYGNGRVHLESSDLKRKTSGTLHVDSDGDGGLVITIVKSSVKRKSGRHTKAPTGLIIR